MRPAARPLRVAMIAPFAVHPKGTTRWRALPLARALAAAGHRVRVVIPPYDWPAHSGRQWQDAGVDVVNIELPDQPGRRPSLATGWVIAHRLLRCALDWQPDVLHCFKPVGPSGLAALLLGSGHSRPRVVLDVDDWEAGWIHRVGYPALWRLTLIWQERHALKRAHAVTAASRWLQDYVAARRALEERAPAVAYLPNGSEPVQEAPTARSDAQGRVLLYTRFVEHSALNAWQVWRCVLAAEPDARLLVAGVGLAGEERQLLALAQQHGSASVTLLGWLPAASRAGLFVAVDAALLPVVDTPLNRAKSPMRLVDLLAHGVAVATHAVGEYGAYVRPDQSGLLALPGRPDELAAHVVQLLHDGPLRARLGEAAARQMATEYSWQRLAPQAVAAYQHALASAWGYPA